MSEFNVETATIQECVDYAVQQIVKQGGQCLGNDGSCVYGNVDGKHCGVGWLLDADNEDLMESWHGAQGLVNGFKGILPPVLTDNGRILEVLQQLHDGISDRESSISRLRTLGIGVSGKWFAEWSAMAGRQT